MSSTYKALLVFLAIGISLSIGIATYKYNSTEADIRTKLVDATYLYDQNTAISNFELMDHHGLPFTPAQLNGQWTFWFFGFTHCPDICPITLGVLSSTVNTLITKHKIKDKISIIFVSVDPERDNTDKLKTYVNAFSEHAIGVTATDDKLAPFLKNMGIIATKQKVSDSQSDYLIDHSSSVYLIAPNTGISALFGAPHSVENFVKDFLTIKKYYQ